MGLVESSWAHPVSAGFALRAEIVGTQGRLSWDYDGLTSGTLYRDRHDPVRYDPLGVRGYRAEVDSLVRAVRSGAASPVPAAAGLSAVRTGLAALESVRTGQTIDLTSWELP
jgi:myo-inositol 2-dehydrogenase/D-chiro-inositol 1-dehydrogenase